MKLISSKKYNNLIVDLKDYEKGYFEMLEAFADKCDSYNDLNNEVLDLREENIKLNNVVSEIRYFLDFNNKTSDNSSKMKCCLCGNSKKGEFTIINGLKYHYCCVEKLYLFLQNCR